MKSDAINSISRDARKDEAANRPVFSPFVGHSVSEVPTDISAADMRALEEELAQLNQELYGLREANKKLEIGTPKWLVTNEKVAFYTGLPKFDSTIWAITHDHLPLFKPTANSSCKHGRLIIMWQSFCQVALVGRVVALE